MFLCMDSLWTQLSYDTKESENNSWLGKVLTFVKATTLQGFKWQFKNESLLFYAHS